MKKYDFKFKKPEFLMGDLVTYDSVIAESEDKAWKILRNSYENNEISADIISVTNFEIGNSYGFVDLDDKFEVLYN